MYAESYVENDVLNQDPVELVRLLYSKAIERVREARGHLEAGRIPQRAETIAHVMEIILELQATLNLEEGGERSRSQRIWRNFTITCKRGWLKRMAGNRRLLWKRWRACWEFSTKGGANAAPRR